MLEKNISLWILIPFVVVLGSCEVAFEPLVNSGLHYTVAGYLDTDSDRQLIRVVPIRSGIDRPTSYEEIPVVTLRNLGTGVQTVWNDSTYTMDDGSLALAFTSRETATAGQTYQVQVTGSRGTSTATVEVPDAPGHPDSLSTIEFPAINNFPVTLHGVTNVIAVEIFYGFRGNTSKSTDDKEAILSAVSEYTGEHRGAEKNGDWEFEVRILDDRDIISDIAPGDILLECMVIRAATPSAGWQPPPGGIFDPEVLIQPGLFSNVENGLGWFGAVSRTSYVWPVINLPENIFVPADIIPVDQDPQVCLDLAQKAFRAI